MNRLYVLHLFDPKFDHCKRFRLRSSSPLGSSPSSSSLSAVSVGLRMWAMLPLLVGGAELSLTERFLLSPRLAAFHDQFPKLSIAPPPPLANGGGGVAGLEWGCEALWSE